MLIADEARCRRSDNQEGQSGQYTIIEELQTGVEPSTTSKVVGESGSRPAAVLPDSKQRHAAASICLQSVT